MSIKPPIEVQSAIVSATAHGTKIITISSMNGVFEFEFSRNEWEKLSESAGWHRRDLPHVNGVSKS
jgi:hypothetical protein